MVTIVRVGELDCIKADAIFRLGLHHSSCAFVGLRRTLDLRPDPNLLEGPAKIEPSGGSGRPLLGRGMTGKVVVTTSLHLSRFHEIRRPY